MVMILTNRSAATNSTLGVVIALMGRTLALAVTMAMEVVPSSDARLLFVTFSVMTVTGVEICNVS